MRLPGIALLCCVLCGAAFGGDWVGKSAPEVKLPNQDGNQVDLASYRGKWVALYFYPKDGTPGCTEEARRFVEFSDRLRAKKIEIVGVSVDDSTSHRRFADQLKIHFNLLADTDGDVAREFGVLKGLGPVKYAARETFLVDPEGTIVYHYAQVNSREHAAQVLRDVERLSREAGIAARR